MEAGAECIRGCDRQLRVIGLQQLEYPGEGAFEREGEIRIAVAVGINWYRSDIGAVCQVDVGLRIRAELQNQRLVGDPNARKLYVAGAIIAGGIHRDGANCRGKAPYFKKYGAQELIGCR